MTATICTDTLRARTAHAAAITTFIIATSMWIAAAVAFAARWGEPRANGLEIRLVGLAMLASVLARTVGGVHARYRKQRQVYADYQVYGGRLGRLETDLAEIKRVVTGIEEDVHLGGQAIAALEEKVEWLAERTERIAQGLEKDKISEKTGEDTADLIRMPRPRPSHLHGLKSS